MIIIFVFKGVENTLLHTAGGHRCGPDNKNVTISALSFAR